jgi:hypothetical protein
MYAGGEEVVAQVEIEERWLLRETITFSSQSCWWNQRHGVGGAVAGKGSKGEKEDGVYSRYNGRRDVSHDDNPRWRLAKPRYMRKYSLSR